MDQEQKNSLINITCPFQVEKFGQLSTCGRIVVKVSPNSYGEGWCRTCRREFYYEVKGDVPRSKIVPRKFKMVSP